MQPEKDYTQKKEQVFVCFDKGNVMRFKPENRLEKQQMYIDYPMSIQVGFRSIYRVIIWLKDGLKLTVNPNNLPFGNFKHITSRVIRTISLELNNNGVIQKN